MEDIYKRYEILNEIIRVAESYIDSSPEGTLYCSKIKKRDTYQYYLADSNDSDKRVFLNPTKDIDSIQLFSTKSYCQNVINVAMAEKKILSKAIEFYEKNDGKLSTQIYDTLDEVIKKNTDALKLSDEEYARWWQLQPYNKKTFSEFDTTEFYTDRNERVRSKSEILIANTLNRLNIPYRYECELVLKDGTVIYPDFTILKKRTREECYLEHSGKMDSLMYTRDLCSRVELYAENDIIVGDKLFMTFEAADHPLSTKTMLKTLKQLFE